MACLAAFGTETEDEGSPRLYFKGRILRLELFVEFMCLSCVYVFLHSPPARTKGSRSAPLSLGTAGEFLSPHSCLLDSLLKLKKAWTILSLLDQYHMSSPWVYIAD